MIRSGRTVWRGSDWAGYRSLHTTRRCLLDTERPTPAPTASAPFPFSPRSTKRSSVVASTAPTSPASTASTVSTAKDVPLTPLRQRITSLRQLPTSFGKNQIIPVRDDIRKELEGIVATFKAPIRYAFAYGSGVFRQTGYAVSVRFVHLPSFRLPRES